MNGKRWRNKERRKPEESERNRDWGYLGPDSDHMGLERQLIIDGKRAWCSRGWTSGAVQRDPWDHHTSNVSHGGTLLQEKVGL